MKPIVLVAPEFVTLTKEAYLVREEYVKQLRDAGAIVLGAGHMRKAKEYARFADALLLPDGSAPVHSSRYGQYDKTFQDAMKSMTTWDDMDVALCKAFLEAGKPVLGIGRGAHIINAVLGGTIKDAPRRLIVDGTLTEQAPNSYVVINSPLRALGHGYGIHTVRITSGTLLDERDTEKRVNTFHSQAVDRLGEGLMTVAMAEDGTIEAFEHETKPVFGFQWHPEHTDLDYKAESGIFEKFVKLTADRSAHHREKTDLPVVAVNGGVAFDKVFETPSWIINSTYVAALGTAGALPVLAVDIEGTDDYAEACDGLILTGSFSYSPRPELQAKLSSEGSRRREEFDERSLNSFKAVPKPIFGICLGEQMINLFMGGSLSFNFKFAQGHEHMMSEHEINAVPGSVLYELYGERFLVNSRHNNRVERVAEGFRVTATADDGTTEAIEHEKLPIWGFQFHPERMRGDIPDPPFGPDSTPLFVWFAKRCKDNQAL